MNNTNIRRGKVGDVEEARRIFTYLQLETIPKMKKEIAEESLVSEDSIESCLNFLVHVGLVELKRTKGKRLYSVLEKKQW